MSQKVSLKDKLESEIQDAVHSVEDFVYEKWHHRLHKKARHHVHKLRTKPDHHKKAVAFSLSFVITATVFVLWYIFSVPRIFQDYRTTQMQNARLGEEINPIDEMKDMYDARKNAASASDAIQVE